MSDPRTDRAIADQARTIINALRTGAMSWAHLVEQAESSEPHRVAMQRAEALALMQAKACVNTSGVAFVGLLARVYSDEIAVRSLRLMLGESFHPATRKEAAAQLAKIGIGAA